MQRQITGVRPPRPVAWLLLVTAAAAVLLTGLAATFATVTRLGAALSPVDAAGWARLLLACGLTLASLGLRALRWVFLLRRSGVRIPIRDAYVGYLSGFSLLLVPLFLGEIFVRAYVHRARNQIAPGRVVQLNILERLCDVVALAALAWAASPLVPLAAVVAVLLGVGLRRTRTAAVALLASVAAWTLPGLGVWIVASGVTRSVSVLDAQTMYAWSSLAGGLTLAPAGIVVTGRELIDQLQGAGLGGTDAVALVFAVRLATVGISTAIGVVMLVVHVWGRVGDGAHFDAIADAYDAQIAPDRREALLARKTSLMRELLVREGRGRRGLDVGCGQGWYVGRMRELGFEVEGLEPSAGQIAKAAQHLGTPALVRQGSALDIPAADATYDFVYTINVLHHLSSIDDQRRAFTEMARVLHPGGLLFVHEINTRNPLFRFYMGYIFPTLNCIDEGVERWLLPERLGGYTDLAVREIRYFTFLPDFLPQAVVRLLGPIERWLEQSKAAPYSAHYMAVLQKPA